jgi:protein-disulfide isomerase/uncharacterized membrane protein
MARKSKKKAGRRAAGQKKAAAPRKGWLLYVTALLLLVGLGSSIYLANLHVQVHARGGGPVSSFCALSEGFNCVTVATSEYSVFLGIPVAIYGIEFFAVVLAVALLSGLGWWRLRRWDSLVFWATALSLPACGALAWISVSCIQSICIVCCVIYGVNLLVFSVLLAGNRGALRQLLTEGPRELLRYVTTARGGAALGLAAVAAVSQFFWVPRLLPSAEAHGAVTPGDSQAWLGQSTAGLSIGPADAPVKIEEFTDFQCPYCGKAHDVMMQVLKEFPGKIRLVHRDFPLDMACHPRLQRPFHPSACRAAYWARCAAAQNKYWPYEVLLFKNRERLEAGDLEDYARTVGLDLGRMRACVGRSETREAVLADITEGLQRRISGTPTFFVNGKMVVGLRSRDFWVQKIGEAIKAAR